MMATAPLPAEKRRWLFLIDLSICGDPHSSKDLFLTSVYHTVTRLLVNSCTQDEDGDVQWTYRFYDCRGGMGRTPHELSKIFVKSAASSTWNRNKEDFAPIRPESLHGFQNMLRNSMGVLLADPLEREYELSAYRMLVQSLTEVLHEFRDEETDSSYGSVTTSMPSSAPSSSNPSWVFTGHKVIVISPIPTSSEEFIRFAFEFDSKVDITTRISTSPALIDNKVDCAGDHAGPQRSYSEARISVSSNLCSMFASKLSAKNVDLLWLDLADLLRTLQNVSSPSDCLGLCAMEYTLLTLREGKERERLKILGEQHLQIGIGIGTTVLSSNIVGPLSTMNGFLECYHRDRRHSICCCQSRWAGVVMPLSLLLIAPQVSSVSSVLSTNRSQSAMSSAGSCVGNICPEQMDRPEMLWRGLVFIPNCQSGQSFSTLCGMDIFLFGSSGRGKGENVFLPNDNKDTSKTTIAIIRKTVCSNVVSPKELTSELFLCLPHLGSTNTSTSKPPMCGNCLLCNANVASFSALLVWLSQHNKCALIDMELQNNDVLSFLLWPLNAVSAIGRVIARIEKPHVPHASENEIAAKRISIDEGSDYQSARFGPFWLENWILSQNLEDSKSIPTLRCAIEQSASDGLQYEAEANNQHDLGSLRNILDQEYLEMKSDNFGSNTDESFHNESSKIDLKSEEFIPSKKDSSVASRPAWEAAIAVAYSSSIYGHSSSKSLEARLHGIWTDAPCFNGNDELEPSSFVCRLASSSFMPNIKMATTVHISPSI
jgi:hypothetical protein